MIQVSFGKSSNRPELRQWLRRTEIAVDALEDGKFDLNDMYTLIKNIMSYMDNNSTQSDVGVSDTVQQCGIAIIRTLMNKHNDVVLFMVDDYEELLRGDSITIRVPKFVIIVAKNMLTEDERKHASVATYIATCDVIALLCQKQPDLIKIISDFLLLKDQKGHSLMKVLKSKIDNPEQGESTRNLLKTLGLLNHFMSEREKSRTASLKRKYGAVIEDLKKYENIQTHVTEAIYLLECIRAMYEPEEP
jgi:hypothetical protein